MDRLKVTDFKEKFTNKKKISQQSQMCLTNLFFFSVLQHLHYWMCFVFLQSLWEFGEKNFLSRQKCTNAFLSLSIIVKLIIDITMKIRWKLVFYGKIYTIYSIPFCLHLQIFWKKSFFGIEIFLMDANWLVMWWLKNLVSLNLT